MTDIVEVVARALFDEEARIVAPFMMTPAGSWEDSPKRHDAYLSAARAAILALAENVSEEMVEAGAHWLRVHHANVSGSNGAFYFDGEAPAMARSALQAALRSVSE